MWIAKRKLTNHYKVPCHAQFKTGTKSYSAKTG